MTATVGSSNFRRFLRAGLACAAMDALWATALALADHRPVLALWQGVASVPFGPSMRDGGAMTALLGLALHVLVAFTWAAVLLALYLSSSRLRKAISSRAGSVMVALVYGPLIWLVMSTVVIPAFIHRPPSFTLRWWIQLAGHAAFVGAPLVWGFRSPRRPG